MNKKIQKVAEDYQALARQQKELDAKMKPLKKELLEYAEENKADFDEAFQMKFPCGAYISLRVSDTLEGDKEQKAELLTNTGDEYAKIDLDEKAVLSEAPKNDRLRKLLTKLGLTIGQKETFAVYAQ